MFGDGLLNFGDILVCAGLCMLIPFAFALALIIAIKNPSLRGLSFGAFFGFLTYVGFGFVFGDSIGLIAGAIVFAITVFNQRHIQVSQNQIGTFFEMQRNQKRKNKNDQEPYIEIIQPPKR